MKLFSTTSLAMLLAFGATTAVVVQPEAALAQKGKQPNFKLSDAVRKPVAEAQKAVQANDAATALAKVNEAKAVAQTPDEIYVVASVQYDVARLSKDLKLQRDAIDAMLQSGRVAEENQAQFYMALGQLAYQTNDFPKAEQALTQAIQKNPGNRDLYPLAAETKYQLKKPAEAVQLIQQAVDSSTASGQPIPKDWYSRGISIAVNAKLAQPFTTLSFGWLKDYPERTNWRDALILYRDLHPADPDLNLDFMRLQRAAGALKGERDYGEYAEATYIKFPGEAKGVIDEGVKAGALNVAQNRSLGELSSIASGKIAADKASLKKTAANGRAALGIADAYASYGDYASAVEMYDKAASLGGIDADAIKLRKGVALAQSGQKDAAKQVLATVGGTRADLAKYWILFIDHPPLA